MCYPILATRFRSWKGLSDTSLRGVYLLCRWAMDPSRRHLPQRIYLATSLLVRISSLIPTGAGASRYPGAAFPLQRALVSILDYLCLDSRDGTGSSLLRLIDSFRHHARVTNVRRFHARRHFLSFAVLSLCRFSWYTGAPLFFARNSISLFSFGSALRGLSFRIMAFFVFTWQSSLASVHRALLESFPLFTRDSLERAKRTVALYGYNNVLLPCHSTSIPGCLIL